MVLTLDHSTTLKNISRQVHVKKRWTHFPDNPILFAHNDLTTFDSLHTEQYDDLSVFLKTFIGHIKHDASLTNLMLKGVNEHSTPE